MTESAAAPHIPGDAGIWVLIAGELGVFTLFFFLFAHARTQDPDTFVAAHLTLDRNLGLANTVLLLTGSLFVALGIHRLKAGMKGSRASIRLGMACGLAFAALKVMEYTEKAEAGITLSTNEFFMYYFALTGSHLFHVVLGLGFLFWAQNAVKGYHLNNLQGRAPAPPSFLAVLRESLTQAHSVVPKVPPEKACDLMMIVGPLAALSTPEPSAKWRGNAAFAGRITFSYQ